MTNQITNDRNLIKFKFNDNYLEFKKLLYKSLEQVYHEYILERNQKFEHITANLEWPWSELSRTPYFGLLTNDVQLNDTPSFVLCMKKSIA